ncbi:MAG: 3-oxoacyl-[acyl-carrier-protein] reductase [Actinomycetia bacterium]|nr:3-oxoacyl-[acyl-carrier-protein] reductase [Actinomycetes bacterium]
MSWAERTALVTGASRGIGRAIAERFAQAGLKVAVNFRQDEAGAAAVVEAIRARGGQAEAFGADVAVPAEAEALVDRVRERFGSLDVLVNNAGTTRDTLLLRMRPDDWDAVLATNLSSVFYCTKAALKSMTRQRFGRIVNISSVAGLVGNAGQANYAAAKAGIIGFTKAVAREWATRGITANCVAPGLIETDFLRHLTESQKAEMVAHIPMGRLGRPEDVAEAVWYLVQADYVTGHVLVVDGGLAMQ